AYPPGLEEELEAHFRRIAGHRIPAAERESVRRRLDRGPHLPPVDAGRIAASTSSGLPGGAALHAAVLRLVSHQTAGVLAQVQDLANAVWACLVLLADAADAADADSTTHDHPDLVALVDAVVERVTAYEREPADAPVGLAELGRRLDRLEAAESARNPRPWFRADLPLDGEAAEDLPLARHLEGCGPVLELGAGAGERLRALAEAGIEASGVEADPDLAGQAVAAGLRVRQGDPLDALGAVPDRALGGVVAVGLVERLAPQQLLGLVRTAADKLRPGGRAVFRATNPRSLWGLANGSAARPDRVLVDPSWLALCCAEAGFASTAVEWSPPPPGGGEPAGAGSEAEIRRLLFRPTAYVLVATR
ncbi:MAG: class I SAM-dependent methyltransferase, partial [Acidimicrobiales bacterium]